MEQIQERVRTLLNSAASKVNKVCYKNTQAVNDPVYNTLTIINQNAVSLVPIKAQKQSFFTQN